MSTYSPPVTQNPIFDPVAWIPRSAPDLSADGNLTILANEINIAYNTAKTINLALTTYGVVNQSYPKINAMSMEDVPVIAGFLPAGSYVVCGTIYVNTINLPGAWNSINISATINGVKQQGLQINNAQAGANYSNTDDTYVPFSFYWANHASDTSQIDAVITCNLQTTGGSFPYNIGPSIDNDISFLQVIGNSPYISY